MQVDADLKWSYTGLEAQRLGTLVAEREAQLVALVRELYGLAAAERVPGVVAHEARARVFRRCATVYEALGEGAFSEEVQLAGMQAATMAAAAVVAEQQQQQQQQGQPDLGRGRVAAA
jgi:hypothetical protein